ncbi:MAG: hypothetical protein F6J97_00250 [Leptolyngbya sp. SIO4C1]|nr:hypothetical protein [Leptolyngbya sp. SIO4C1]
MNLYFLPAIWVAAILSCIHLSDCTASRGDRYAWVVIAIASILWPIVLPISAVELVRKSARKRAAKRRHQLWSSF